MRKLITFFSFFIIITIFSSTHGKANEYDHSIDLNEIKFLWKITEDSIHIKLSAKTTGWVGIGFNPSQEMKDANLILGYVKDGTPKVTDHFGTTNRQHMKDKKVGSFPHLFSFAKKEI